MRSAVYSWIALLLAATNSTLASADPSDKAGWSVDTDPRHRAFLKWVPEERAPRALLFACLRDVDTFTTISYAVAYKLGERDEIEHVKLTLSNGTARFEAEGSVRLDPVVGRSNFESELDIHDGHQRRALEEQLLTVLERPGDATLTIMPGEPSGGARTLQIPLAGIAPALTRFRSICFK